MRIPNKQWIDSDYSGCFYAIKTWHHLIMVVIKTDFLLISNFEDVFNDLYLKEET